MKKVSVIIPDECYEKLQQLVRNGEFVSISEAIRTILRLYLDCY